MVETFNQAWLSSFSLSLRANHRAEHGLSACPICNKRMKEEDVFLHLDTHQQDNGQPQTKISPKSSTRFIPRTPSQ